MTPERIAELRYWLQRGPRPPLDMEATIAEALDEIERLQARKAAPTRGQVVAVLSDRLRGVIGDDIRKTLAFTGADVLAAAGLLAEPEREPGWYWAKWGTRDWEAAKFDGAMWLPRGVRNPERIGPRIEGPPQTGKD